MKLQFEILKSTRENVLKLVDELSIEQWNVIPEGYHNNIGWNFCHMMLTQQLLTYNLCDLPMQVPERIVELFKKGTKPDTAISEEVIMYFKSEFLSSVSTLEEDYKMGLFNSFNTYPTSYGVTLDSIETAIMFNNVHEGLHYGYIMAMKKNL